jgi:hypothetical protein
MNYSSIIRQDLNMYLHHTLDSNPLSTAYITSQTSLSSNPDPTTPSSSLSSSSKSIPQDIIMKASNPDKYEGHNDEIPEVATDHHKLDCPYAELVTFWKAPTAADTNYVNPFTDNRETKYVTFEPGILSYHILSYPIISYHILSYHILSYIH